MKSAISFLAAVLFIASAFAQPTSRHTLILKAVDLYNGAKAERIRLSVNGKFVTLDLRNPDKELAGVIETDPLDIYDPQNAGISLEASPIDFAVKVHADCPASARLRLSYRSGNSFFSDDEWSPWVAANGMNLRIDHPKGRYLRLRLDLRANQKDQLPSVSAVEIASTSHDARGQEGDLNVTRFENERIIRSAYSFEWERPDNPIIQKFMTESRYSEAFARGKSEIEKMTLLSKQVAATANDRSSMWNTDYPWDVTRICSYSNGKTVIEGHCLSYAIALVSAMTGMHQYSRHWAVCGFRDMDHEVVEAWSNDLRKWIYLDPSLSQYYLALDGKHPLSLLEMHNIINRTFIKDGQDWHMPLETMAAQIKATGGKTPIQCIDDGWHYGEPAPADYNWGWFHGYLADGFMRLTTRNNFHSKREPWFPHFGEGQDFDVFASYVDEKTPPFSPAVKHFSGRARDFWFTLNQASIKARRLGTSAIELEFGNSQPFFKRYMISVNGAAPAQAKSPYRWNIKPGTNSLTVTPEDEWRVKGIPSSITIN